MFQTAAMAVGDLEVTAERENVISFSHTILSTQASLLIRKAKSTQNFFQVRLLVQPLLSSRTLLGPGDTLDRHHGSVSAAHSL